MSAPVELPAPTGTKPRADQACKLRNRMKCRLTFRCSGGTPTFVSWHFIHHRPLQPVVMPSAHQRRPSSAGTMAKGPEDVSTNSQADPSAHLPECTTFGGNAE